MVNINASTLLPSIVTDESNDDKDGDCRKSSSTYMCDHWHPWTYRQSAVNDAHFKHPPPQVILAEVEIRANLQNAERALQSLYSSNNGAREQALAAGKSATLQIAVKTDANSTSDCQYIYHYNTILYPSNTNTDELIKCSASCMSIF